MSIFGAFDAFGGQGRQLTQGEINFNNAQAQNAVQRQINNIHDQYAARIRELEIALAVKTASAKAADERGNTLKKALHAIAPNHALFQTTGRKCKNGEAETALGVIWISTFDRNLSGKVPGSPRDYRAI